MAKVQAEQVHYMRRKVQRVSVRRLTGPKKTALKIGLRAPAFYIILIFVGSVAGLWLNGKIERLEREHAFHLLLHP